MIDVSKCNIQELLSQLVIFTFRYIRSYNKEDNMKVQDTCHHLVSALRPAP